MIETDREDPMEVTRNGSWQGSLRLEGYKWHNVLLLLVDLAILSAALWLALGLHPFVPMHRLSEYSLWGWSRWFLLLWALWVPVASAIDLYEPTVAGDADRALVFTVLTLVLVGLVYVLIPIISVPLINPPWTWFVFMGTAALALCLWRGAYAFLWAPVPLQRLALIGRPSVIEPLAAALEPLSQVRVVSILGANSLSSVTVPGSSLAAPTTQSDLPLGERPDAIVIDPHLFHEPDMARLLSQWSAGGLAITSITACYETWLGQIPLEHLDLADWIGQMHERQMVFRAWDMTCRLFDIVWALLALPVLGIALVVVGLTRRGISEAPIIVAIPHVGRQGKRVNLLHFDESIPHWLRRLPLVWNLLLGHVTLIGPQPLPQAAWPCDSATATLCQLRTVMRPGLISWAQTRRLRARIDDQSVSADLMYDLYYIKQRGPSRDLAVVYHVLKSALASERSLVLTNPS
jgi:lipopolysaccharide/colanic/teichoic acid biosynthesis glycosyltransferase